MDGKKLLSLLICATLNFSYSATFAPRVAQAASAKKSFNIREHEATRAGIRAKKRNLEKKLKEVNKKIHDKRKQSDNVNKQILSIQDQISKINVNIENLNNEIIKKNQYIAKAQGSIKENTDLLMRRLVAIYKAGEVHLIDLIFRAKTFDDLIDKAEVIAKISEHDNKLLATLKNEIISVEKEKVTIQKNKKTIEEEKISLSAKKSDLQRLFVENEKLLKELEGEQAVSQVEIDENDAEYQRIQREIMNYYVEEARRSAGQNASHRSIAQRMSSMAIVPSEDGFAWPVPGYTCLSSDYMEKRGSVYHKGIDIASTGIYGKSVVAVDHGFVFATYSHCHHDYGKIRSCGCGGGYGNYVILAHGNGKISIYGHLSQVFVKEGQTVSRSQKIGEVGTTGYSTGPHLHFQTKRNGIDYNPLDEYRK